MLFLLSVISQNLKRAPPGGLDPPTFRLTAERASQLRHGGILLYRQILLTQFIGVYHLRALLYVNINGNVSYMHNMCVSTVKEILIGYNVAFKNPKPQFNFHLLSMVKTSDQITRSM